MVKLKMIINVFLLLTISIYLHPVGTSIAGTCNEMSSIGSTQTLTGDHVYSENWQSELQFQYDPSNPEEIARNSSIFLNVIGGCSPYTWSVSGTGFSLGTEGEPTGPTNTLYADGTACGAATITVTGCDGTQVEGYVRCTVGTWKHISYCAREATEYACIHECTSAYHESVVIGKLLYSVSLECIRSDRCYTCKGEYASHWQAPDPCLTPGVAPPITWDCVGHSHCDSCPGELAMDIAYQVYEWTCN
jgi:hypothetical protein